MATDCLYSVGERVLCASHVLEIVECNPVSLMMDSILDWKNNPIYKVKIVGDNHSMYLLSELMIVCSESYTDLGV